MNFRLKKKSEWTSSNRKPFFFCLVKIDYMLLATKAMHFGFGLNWNQTADGIYVHLSGPPKGGFYYAMPGKYLWVLSP